MGRYDRNRIFTETEMTKLQASKICIVGCGGLGGYLAEMLVRVGIGQVVLVDGDVFDESNLNRQLYATTDNLGRSKALEAKKRLAAINPETRIFAHHAKLDQGNVYDMIQDCDLVMDALDNIATRFIVQQACEKSGIPMVHGAIAGWYGQVTTILPGDRTLDRIYQESDESGIEDELGNPSFTPATIASIQIAEAMKVLVGRDEILRNKILMVDLLDNEFHIIAI